MVNCLEVMVISPFRPQRKHMDSGIMRDLIHREQRRNNTGRRSGICKVLIIR